jgi:hypothetical protein
LSASAGGRAGRLISRVRLVGRIPSIWSCHGRPLLGPNLFGEFILPHYKRYIQFLLREALAQ